MTRFDKIRELVDTVEAVGGELFTVTHGERPGTVKARIGLQEPGQDSYLTVFDIESPDPARSIRAFISPSGIPIDEPGAELVGRRAVQPDLAGQDRLQRLVDGTDD